MATKKRRKRSSAPRKRLSSGPRTKALTTARRRRKKRGLADAFTPAAAKNAAMTMVKGGVGGVATKLLEKAAAKFVPGTMGKAASIALVLGGSFVAHAVMKQPDVSAGMAGALGYSLSSNIPGLNDADFADEDALYDDAEFMDEYGNPLDEDYLDDDYLDDDYLSGSYDNGWPSY